MNQPTQDIAQSLSIEILSKDGRRAYPLSAPLTTVGAAADNDFVVADMHLPDYAISLHLQGESLEVRGIEGFTFDFQGSKTSRVLLEAGDELGLPGGRLLLRADLESLPAIQDATQASQENPIAAGQAQAALKAMMALQKRIGQEKALQPILEAVLDSVLSLVNGGEGFAFTLDGSGRPTTLASRSKKTSTPSLQRLYSDSIVQAAITTRRPVLLRSAANDAQFASAESVVSLNLKSAIACPVEIAGRLIGVFYVGTTRLGQGFDEGDRDTLSLFAILAGSLLQNAAYIEQQNVLLQAAHAQNPAFGFIAENQVMLRVLQEVDMVAASSLNILLRGETGTGKDLLALRLHRQSPRRDKPFLVVNCSTLRGEMLAGELFGYKRGAFTGAVRDYRGLFLSAQGGTLFLDEIGETEVGLQASLLRVAETGRVKPLGQAHEEMADVRLVCATHRDLDRMVREGSFREDLFYRLNQHAISIPPLRERGEDILLLAYHFLAKARAGHPQKGIVDFHPETLDKLPFYRWSGNVRELHNAVFKSVVLAQTPFAKIDFPAGEQGLLDLEEATKRFQDSHILRGLSICAGDKEKAAALLKMGRSTFFRRLAEIQERKPN